MSNEYAQSHRLLRRVCTTVRVDGMPHQQPFLQSFVVNRRFKSPKQAQALDPTRLRRLVGTRGPLAAVGEALHSEDGIVCWELDPAYAAWLWPLMQKATGLALAIKETDLEPLEPGDMSASPRAPTEPEKDHILRLPDREQDCVPVYTLVLKGKPPLVHKAFPTRTANMRALHFCRRQISQE